MRKSGSLASVPTLGTFPPVGFLCLTAIWWVFFSSSYILYCHMWPLSLRSLSFYNKRQKWSQSRREERWKGTGKIRGRENWNQNILYEKKNLCSIKGENNGESYLARIKKEGMTLS